MLRLAGLAIAVGLADSLNPTTFGPALYLATVQHRVWRVAQFTIGVFGVSLAGGLLLTLGPGRLLLDLVPHPRSDVRHAIELIAGLALLGGAVGLWLGRHRLAHRGLPKRSTGGSALVAGASIMAIELPTAAPYVAVIATIVASNVGIPQQIALLVIFNLAFVAPLLAIVGVLIVAGDRADPMLRRASSWLQQRWPLVLAGILLLVGAGLTVAGAAGLLTG